MPIERHRERRILAKEAGFGSVSWVSVLAGTLSAYGLTAALLAIAGGIAAAINNGSDFSTVSPGGLKLTSAIVVAVALFVSYLFGGYVAGRMARRSGATNGLGVFLLGVILAVAVGVWVKEAGGGTGIANTLRDVGAPTTWHDWRAVGTIAGAAALVAMLVASLLGGASGESWHTKLMKRALDPGVGPASVPVAPVAPAVASAPVVEDRAAVADQTEAETVAVDRGGWRHLLHH